MKRFFSVAGLVLLLGISAGAQSLPAPHPAPDTKHRILLPWGYIEASNNEVSIVSLVDDPPGLRLASVTGSLGKLSFNLLRADGVQEELVLIQGKQDRRFANAFGGEITIHLRQPFVDGDAAMTEVLTLRHDLIILHVPVYQEK